MARPISSDEADDLFGTLSPYSRVALAVSGGPDSLALMQLAAAWRNRTPGAPDFVVLTVDHGLRPESAGEARLVASQAAERGLAHVTLVWEGPKPNHGIEAAARAARYDLMAGYGHAWGIEAIVTAHHLDDQAETLLMRLARGSGVDGLAAMPTIGEWAGMPIARPLLDAPKDRLEATAEDSGLRFVQDPANTDPRFERSRLRASRAALGALGLTPAALAHSAKRLRRARDALEHGARDFISAHARIHDAGYADIDHEALRRAPEEIALRGLSRLLHAIGGASEAPRLRALERLFLALRSGKTAGTLAGCRLGLRDPSLRIMREFRGPGLPELDLLPGRSALWDRRILVRLANEADGPLRVRALGADGIGDLKARGTLVPLPRAALMTVASFWRGGAIVAAPQIGFSGERNRPGFCSAAFADRRLFGGTSERLRN